MLDKSLPRNALSLLLLGGQASATYLYVSSYSGVVTTLNLSKDSNGTSLTAVASDSQCGSSPSWLELTEDGTLFCVDEGFATWPNGTLSTYSTNADGSIELLHAEITINGAVSTVHYGAGGNGVAMAHYGGSAFTTWDTTDPATFSPLSEEIFELDGPGTNPDRQEAPHPHQAVTDPTGKFILVPDLGADLVRIYSTSEDDLSVTSLEPLSVAAGAGPRHVAFAVHGETTYMYLITELSNTIYGYTVTYGEDSLGFEQIYESGTHGEGVEVPEGASAAEIWVSADQKFLIASSRNENIYEIPNFDPTNSTAIVSDSIINFAVDPATGGLTQLQDIPAGGRVPRQFSVNRDGTLVAVGLQGDGRVVIIARDAESGELGDFVAAIPVEGEVTSVIFNEN